MKNKILLSLFALALPMFADARGTGVGNGGDSARTAYIEKLKRELSISSKKQDMDSLYDWCSRVTRMLRREKGRAMIQIQSDNLRAAEETLKDALVVASQSLRVDPQQSTPMTKRMIDRGVIYADGIEHALPKNTRLNLLTSIDFMTGFIDLIFRVDEGLDRPYYIPYHYRYGRCRDACDGFDLRAFERLYLEYARAELLFVVEHSVNEDMRDGRIIVTPIGKPEAFLKLAELSSGLLAREISETLESYRNACVVTDLESLNEILRDYNLFGDRSYFPNFRYAVEGAAMEIRRILNNFQGGCGLPRYRY